MVAAGRQQGAARHDSLRFDRCSDHKMLHGDRGMETAHKLLSACVSKQEF